MSASPESLAEILLEALEPDLARAELRWHLDHCAAMVRQFRPQDNVELRVARMASEILADLADLLDVI